MEVNIPGLVAVVVFYILILLIGVWGSNTSRKVEKTVDGSKSEVTIVGGRNINVFVGVFTMTATWVGGGYIMGTCEAVYSPTRGLIWALGLPAYVLNFVLGGLVFAKPMRSKRYVTMLDPFQKLYGNAFTSMLLLPVLFSDILWVAAILAALGGTMSIILGVSSSISIIVSAVVSIVYTFLGGLYSVAYTDIIQLCFIFVSMWICVPFLILSPAVSGNLRLPHLNESSGPSWFGELKMADAGIWTDEFLLLGLGGLAYQAFYQRVLSAASAVQAQTTCLISSVAVFIMGIPSVIIGVTAAAADWNQTDYGLPTPFEQGDAGKILPLALQNLTPQWVSVLGIASLAAAVMSSMDSALLSSASVFTQNIYKATLRKQASERELQWVIRLSVLLIGVGGAGLAFGDDSVLAFWLLSGDFVYCVVFPQLVCVLFFSSVNTYGALCGYLLGLGMRLFSGEPLLGIPSVLLYPGWKEENGDIIQCFPFRTIAMLASLVCIVAVSTLAKLCFQHTSVPQSWDVLKVFEDKREVQMAGSTPVPHEEENDTLQTIL